MILKKTLTGLFLLVAVLLAAESNVPEYTYLDESFRPVAPEAAGFSQKVQTVQFKFPFPVTVESVSCTSPASARIDRIEVFSGSTPEMFRRIVRYYPGKVPPQKPYTIPLKKTVCAQYFTVRITQEANPGLEGVAAEGIRFTISAEDRYRIERMPDMNRILKYLPRYPRPVYGVDETVNLDFVASRAWRGPVHYTLKDSGGKTVRNEDVNVIVLHRIDIFSIQQEPLPEGRYEGSICSKEGGIDEKFSFIVQPPDESAE